MINDLPLAGLRIVVTRPREQAAQLVQGIEKLGGVCIQFPLLEITRIDNNLPLHDLVKRLHDFHLAIFISPNAVRYGMEAILGIGELPGTMQIATVGLGSAKALLDYGVARVISPQEKFDSETLLELPEMQDVSGKHVVIFRGDKGRELLGDTLKSRGAIVEYVSCYHRSNPQHDVTALLAAKPDALGVSSSESLHNLWEISSPADKEQLTVLPLFVSHARIAAAAHKLGWQNIITATGGDEGLLAGLVTWAKLRKSKP